MAKSASSKKPASSDGKIFVIDTNVILHDSTCIKKFEENDVVIPSTVVEELDNFKKGREDRSFHAREFTRMLDSIRGPKIFNGGVSLGKELGNIRVKLESELEGIIQKSFIDLKKADIRILNTALVLKRENPDKRVVLITKDANLRIRASAVGVESQDYTSDHVKTEYKGYRIIEGSNSELINELYSDPFFIEAKRVENDFIANEFVIMRNGSASALAIFSENVLKRIEKSHCYGIIPRNAEQTFALKALSNSDIPLVTITGKAGTGKTILALAAAIENRKKFQQIFVARPTVPLSNRDSGYLPGNIQEKIAPFMQPIYDNLSVILNQFKENDPNRTRIEAMQSNGKIVVTPLSYIRGRSLVGIYLLIDEAQNLTPHEVKTIITRAGEGTKVVFTGDIHQIDHPYLDQYSNGLSYIIEKFKGQNLFAHINLEKGERSDLSEIASILL